MRAISIPLLLSLLVLISLMGLIRHQSKDLQMGNNFHRWSEDYSVVMDKALAGPIPGIIADFYMLDVFTIYYDAKHLQEPESMGFISTYLNRAQNLDPNFFDIYRLAGSLLAYDADRPLEAVLLLRKGVDSRVDTWEFAFFAGFLAHDRLGDDELAFEMMTKVINREGVPLMVYTLASRFLESSATKEDAIAFLRGLLQLVPKDYHDGILHRIHELEEE